MMLRALLRKNPVERTSSSADGRNVEYVRTVYRGDRYKFEVESARKPVLAGRG